MDIADRMKDYESVSKTKLMHRQPVIARIDGRAFHTLTKGFDKPFDKIFMETMQETMLQLCKNIQGCVLGYTQSDEISLLLTDYKKLNSSAFFDYEVQKCCSVIASMATLYFRKSFENICDEAWEKGKEKGFNASKYKSMDNAMFDCRVFNLPFDEVTNYFYWRQTDATRNSIQMVAHSLYPHKELHNLNCNQLQEKLFLDHGINWSTDYTTECKRGTCAKRVKKAIALLDWLLPDGQSVKAEKSCFVWKIDYDIPIFKGDGREYIESLVNYREE